MLYGVPLCPYCKHCVSIDKSGQIECKMNVRGDIKIFCIYFEPKSK